MKERVILRSSVNTAWGYISLSIYWATENFWPRKINVRRARKNLKMGVQRHNCRKTKKLESQETGSGP